MEAPLWLLLVWGWVGSIDSLYNHLYRYRLHSHASSFTEHCVHTLLTVVLIVTAFMLVFVEMGRLGFALFLGVQVFALILTVWDVSIEPASRAPLGGFPPHEYLLHTIIFLLHGAFVWAVVANADQLVHGSGFGLLRWPPLPTFLLIQAGGFVLIGAGALALHVYLIGVGYRALYITPGTPAVGLQRP